MKRLMDIQQKLKANKDLFNSYGNYHYRSTETILEALKPLLKEHNLCILITDELQTIGDRYYVKAIVKLIDTEGKLVAETSAFAREEESKKGMDGSQITGASSSYSRKYALNGMFAIDDAKDSDTTNKHGKEDIKQDKTEKKENNVFISFEQKNALKTALNDGKKYASLMNSYGGKIPVDVYEEIMKEYSQKEEYQESVLKVEENEANRK